MDDIPPLLVARLMDLAEVQAVVESALGGGVALVPLEDPPMSDGPHAVVVHAPGLSEPLVLSGVPAGEPTAGLYPIRVQPIDAGQVDKLRALRARVSSKPPNRPKSFPREDRTLPDARADPLLGAQLANGKYEIEAPLGGGAYGKVYKGRHRTLNKSVAVKVLQGFMERDAEFAARFQREARAASKLDHPNVAQVLDFGEEPDGMLYIVMEYLHGQNLRDLLAVGHPLPPARIVEIMSQVCAALSAAHEEGVVHRDVKPENVVISLKRNDDGELVELVKLCDFGVATMQPRGTDAGGKYVSTGGTTVAGTPEYMSPEQARGEKVDARTDIYSCGVLLYEMACGEVPFTATSPVAVLVAHASDEPRPPSSIHARVDKRLEQVVLKALAKQPSARQQSARELRADLRRIVNASGELRAMRRSTLSPPIPREEGESAPAAKATANALDGTADTAPVDAVIDVKESRGAKLTPPPAPDPGPPPPSIADPAMGFAEFLSAVTAAIAQTTYQERAHPEFARSLAHLVSVTSKPLERRGEITFARRDAQKSDLVVVTGAGETLDLARAAPGGVGSSCAQRLSEFFARRGLVSLTFKEGLSERELRGTVELLNGPELSTSELASHFVALKLSKISALFVNDVLGRERRLPWPVMLCISRIARDVALVPKIAPDSDPSQRRRLRVALTGDVTRTLKLPEQLKMLLSSWDLIAFEVGESEEFKKIDIASALVISLLHPMLLRVARLMLTDTERSAQEPSLMESFGMPPPEDVRTLLQVIGSRFLGERTIESDEILRELYARAVLSFPELPEDLQAWVLAEQQAGELAKSPEQILGVLDTVVGAALYGREVAKLARAMRILARRGAVDALWAIVARLQRHARNASAGEDTREAIAARALASMADPDVLAPVAGVLLAGSETLRDPAQSILVSFGEAGAQALATARVAGGEIVRIRFVEAMKEIGRAAVGPLTLLLDRIIGGAGGDGDVGLAEDVLRGLPEIQNERLGMMVAGMLRHRAPSVRRAAATALAAPWGAQARSVLIGALDDSDESVRVAALTGLRKVGAVDLEMVRRVQRILTSVGTGDNACAVAAALLADVVPQAREEAITVLCAAIEPRSRSVVALLTGSAAPASQTASLVVETIARVLLTIGAARGREAVEKRASKSSGQIRDCLAAILKG